jgi:chromosome-anchoring protein RacA
MNTSEVSKLLGVSHSTINRWITQLKLEIDRTALGHYRFSEKDITLLQNIQDQLNNGTILQKVQIGEKKVRKATISNKQPIVNENKMFEMLQEKVAHIEKRLETKADDVVSYQLLQHRSDIEELQKTINKLTNQLETLESKLKNEAQADYFIAFNETATTEKPKKKPFLKTFFG